MPFWNRKKHDPELLGVGDWSPDLHWALDAAPTGESMAEVLGREPEAAIVAAVVFPDQQSAIYARINPQVLTLAAIDGQPFGKTIQIEIPGLEVLNQLGEPLEGKTD